MPERYSSSLKPGGGDERPSGKEADEREELDAVLQFVVQSVGAVDLESREDRGGFVLRHLFALRCVSHNVVDELVEGRVGGREQPALDSEAS